MIVKRRLAISKTLGQLSEFELKAFKRMLWKYYPQSFSTPPQGMDIVDLVDRLLECYTLEVSLHITKTHLAEMGKNKLVDRLDTLCLRSKYL
uniref:Pyrin domain-containing protein n=1 Tax=Amphilophus citrinellus TaxID=61819 RepID=A0A3Q0S5P6_AMPCI